ncbi:hypothetical protein K470DRAFT_268010 [Piedraia hortae CBS 480.64]|uniref:Fms interacting protein n=1 Tax=Piedraia hortae CBS 480.64 TaxID=1314780 RepID=A0A6A7CAE9_9PEZI|nr:hypothetical protein K470DRAFT_268010 [Piedraia hortae CBS 480.64]
MPDPRITSPELLNVLTTAADAHSTANAILDLTHPPPPTPSTPQDTTTTDTLSTLHKTLIAQLAQLRGQQRTALLSIRTTRAETASSRREIDGLHLQLQNLVYEQRHLASEIASCEGFEHRYMTLPLVSEKEFFEEFPECKGAGEHEVMTRRIEDELSKRQTLEEERIALVKKKEGLVKLNKARREELAKLDAELERWTNGQVNVRRLFEVHEGSNKMTGRG